MKLIMLKQVSLSDYIMLFLGLHVWKVMYVREECLKFSEFIYWSSCFDYVYACTNSWLISGSVACGD